jgi:RHS repeat-associated protein
LGRTTTYDYDVRDRQVLITDPNGNTISTEYDVKSNVIAIVDGNGNRTTYEYDRINRQTAVIDPDNFTTTYTYDGVGNLLTITDGENNTTTYTYDQANRLLTDTNELGFSRSYSYDGAYNMVSMTDRNNRTTEFTYDALNRLVEENWINDSNFITYVYDEASRLVSVSDEDSSYGYTYDERNFLTSVDNLGTAGVPNVLLEYTYDGVGNMLTVTDTIAGIVSGVESYIYDELDRVVTLTQSGINVSDKRVDFSYDEASQLMGIDRFSDLTGNNLVAESDYIYDQFGRLTDLIHVGVATYGWVYDQANRITQFTSPDGVANYSYDDRDQLVSADYDYQSDESYSYDGTGNRTNAGYVTGTNNQLLSDGTYNYDVYDGEGNRLRRTEIATGEVTEYEWDYRNRLVGVVTKDVNGNILDSVEYTYDVYDRRIGKSVDSDGDGNLDIEERFVLDGDEIALVFDGEGNLIERFLHGVMVDQVLAQENGDRTVYWALADNQGSIRYVLDNQGNIINEITYNAFGEVTSESNSAIDFRFGYTGREFDEETGLYYYRSRYYDATVGRFVSEDTIGFEGGDSNLYRYVINSPTNYSDPYGEDLYSFVDKLDEFAAGFGGVVTSPLKPFGLDTNSIREKLYGENATKNHEGGFFTAGQVVGVANMIALGVVTPTSLVASLSPAQKFAIGYEILSTGVGAYQSTTNFMNGCGSALDLLNFAPAIGFLGGKAWDNFVHPSQLNAIDNWFATGVKNGFRRNLGAIRANHFKNNSTVFYHGTDPIVAKNIRNNGIDLSYTRYDADFGAGFYTSTQKQTALWSPKARLYDDVDVVTFRISNQKLEQLDSLAFNSASNEWSDFVKFHKNLKPKTLMHGGKKYDLVTGPLFKRIRKNGDILSWGDRVQTSIHTQKAVNLFNKNIRQ